MKNKTKLKPVWMTKEAIKSVKMKHRAWSKYMRTRDHIHYIYFCRARNSATRECRKARKQFENKIAEEQNPKVFYKYVNSRRKVNTGITKLQDENGEITENNQNKAEILNNYFHSVFVKEDKSSLPN